MADTTRRIVEVQVDNAEAIKLMAEYNAKIEESAKKGKDLREQIKQREKASKDAGKTTAEREELAKYKAEQAAYKAELRMVEKEVQNNIVAGQTHKNTLKGLGAELSSAKDELRKMTIILSAMRKYCVFIGILGLLTGSETYAQNRMNIDNAFMECRYSLRYLKDTVDVDKTTDDYMILRIGSKTSKYFSYTTFLIDSLQEADIAAGMPVELMLQNRNTKYGRRGESYNIVKVFTENKLVYTDKIAAKYYRYEEPIPDFKWTLQAQTRDIWGYECFLAKCSFRGRKYCAWYTPEIAVNDGPWKFCGLPGLILEVYDENKQYVFEFAGIIRLSRIIALDNNQSVVTTREKFNQLLRHYYSDRLGFWKETTGVKFTVSGASIPEPKPLKYDLMERK